jgi:hypothetical protein
METYKVKQFFTDLKTGDERHPGDLVEFSQERVKEIQKVDPELIELHKVDVLPDPEPVTLRKANTKK